jgi:hypothetical protein
MGGEGGNCHLKTVAIIKMHINKGAGGVRNDAARPRAQGTRRGR